MADMPAFAEASTDKGDGETEGIDGIAGGGFCGGGIGRTGGSNETGGGITDSSGFISLMRSPKETDVETEDGSGDMGGGGDTGGGNEEIEGIGGLEGED